MIVIFFSLFEWFFYIGGIYIVYKIIKWTLTKTISPKGKYILVTGAANGIGYDTTVALLKKGCNVIATDVDIKSLREKNFFERHRLEFVLNFDEDAKPNLKINDERGELNLNENYKEENLDDKYNENEDLNNDSNENNQNNIENYNDNNNENYNENYNDNNENLTILEKINQFKENLSLWRCEDSDQGILIPVKMDVSKLEDIIRAKEKIVSLFPKNEKFLFGIVNNAGVALNLGFEQASLLEYEDEELQKITNINQLGVIRTTRQFFSLLNRNDQVDTPCIVNVASVAGYISLPFFSFYAATKHAVRSYSDSLRRELYYHNCRVSCIEPGFTNTAILSLPKIKPSSEWYDEMLFSQKNGNKVFKSSQSTESVVKAILRGLFDDPSPSHQIVETHFNMRLSYLLAIYIIPTKILDTILKFSYYFYRKRKTKINELKK